MNNEIVLFEADDKSITLSVMVDQETVWLNRNQMAELFDRDVKTIGKHINNALREELDNQEVVAKFATTAPHGAMDGKTQTHMEEIRRGVRFGYRKETGLWQPRFYHIHVNAKWFLLVCQRVAVDGEGEVGVRIGLIFQGEVPPFFRDWLEAVFQHGIS